MPRPSIRNGVGREPGQLHPWHLDEGELEERERQLFLEQQAEEAYYQSQPGVEPFRCGDCGLVHRGPCYDGPDDDPGEEPAWLRRI